MEFRQTLYTPAHYFHGWDVRLHYREVKDLLMQTPTNKPEADKPEESKQAPKGDNFQFDFSF